MFECLNKNYDDWFLKLKSVKNDKSTVLNLKSSVSLNDLIEESSDEFDDMLQI